MMLIPEDGKLYWTNRPVMESEAYNMDFQRPCHPRLKKAKWNHRGVLYLYSFNHETGEIDEDANAKVLIGDKQDIENGWRKNYFFETEVEALRFFMFEMAEYIKSLQVEAKEAAEGIQKANVRLIWLTQKHQI